MGRKGVKNKHTVKELQAKDKAAWAKQGNAGGGGSAAAARIARGLAVAVRCEVCKADQPNIMSMSAHYDSKHSKLEYPKASYEAQFDALRDAKKSEKALAGKPKS